ncbi:hypothetical protein [Aquabacter spiritensis]|uniref:Uncharacterized protein n=1 Tax=Aquabacter spiritensis TaxID=933073 RepID=A0A4R3LXX8_9HYPH|nr:hypothetical protein [Aquabacter spiritensis]TCT05524.1 hypothetical protein EDC64_10481 [Aquabacter spiritensis]
MKSDTDPRNSGAVKLQYWSPSHSVNAPDAWPDPLAFDTVEDAVAFAMTQAPFGREVAWLRTPEGAVLKPDQIRRAYEMKRS